jgi:hypothetical protein
MNKRLIPFIFVAALAMFFGVLVAYVFTPKQKQETKTESVNAKQIIDSIEQNFYESYELKSKLSSQVLSKQIDSFKAEYNKAKISLNAERKKVAVLSNAVEVANSLNDTSSFFTFCNELAAQVKIQDIEISNLTRQSDSLQNKNDNLNKLMEARVSQWKNTFGLLKAQAITQANKLDSLGTKYNSLQKKENKKWTVGIGACGGLTNFGFGGAVGIVVSKTVFKF